MSADTAALVEHCAYNIREIPEPATINEALESTHAKEWKLATESEYSSLMENDTWWNYLKGEQRLGVSGFLESNDGEGKAVQFISQLVAIGYSQTHGIDFEETFSLVFRFLSVRTLLALVVQKNIKWT